MSVQTELPSSTNKGVAYIHRLLRPRHDSGDIRWMLRGFCRKHQYPELWDTDYPEKNDMGIAACMTLCPVQKECFAFAMKNREPSNIWGGSTPKDRRKVNRILLARRKTA